MTGDQKSSWLVWSPRRYLFAGGAYALGVNASGEARQAEQNSQVVLVTATRIQEQTLETTDSFNGSVRLGTEYGVTVQPSDNMQSVVTRAPKGPGDSLTSGEIALEVSGRPLIALDLPFALYRDLHPGDTGPDVSALQTALAGLGVYGGKVDSIYGQQTAESVKRLYTQLGYAPPEPDAALIDAQHAAEAARIAITAETPPSEAEAVRVAAQAATFAALTPTSATEIVRLQGPSTVVSTATVGDFPTIDQAAMILRSGTPQAILRVNGVDVSNFSAGMTVMVAGVGSSGSTSHIGGVLCGALPGRRPQLPRVSTRPRRHHHLANRARLAANTNSRGHGQRTEFNFLGSPYR